MKVAIGYPPFESNKGSARLSQNRQFFWSKTPSAIYPVVAAQAATLLKKNGHEVVWLDGQAELWNYQKWLTELQNNNPKMIIMESKTPVIKKHWDIIRHLKSLLPEMKTVLVGDHVTAMPKESMENSPVDYVLTGGNYDFLILNLINYLSGKSALEPGIWYRDKHKIKNTGDFVHNQNLNDLPHIDRNLTKWQLYAYKNGNFKYTPGTYIMSGRDCWWRRSGGCSFCSWTVLYPKFMTRNPEDVLSEIGEIIENYNVKEIFDDTGTFPVGLWLEKFLSGYISRGYHKKIRMGANFRFGILKKKDYELLSKARSRFLLFGLESANQKTVDRLGKGIQINKIEAELETIKEVNRNNGNNLEPHVTCMPGYPWETADDAKSTVNLCKNLFNKRLINTLQATVVVPYPGTRLYKEAVKNKWLKTSDWNDFDMRSSVFKLQISDSELSNLIKSTYMSFLRPSYILKIISSVRSYKDIQYLAGSFFKAVQHFRDF